MDCKDNQGKPYCYARRMYKRFKWDTKVRLDLTVFNNLISCKPSRIFLCSTHELMGEWIPDNWIKNIIDLINICQPQHTWLLLSKNPSRYADFDWPKNCYLGQTVTSPGDFYDTGVNPDFFSFEPLLTDLAQYPIKSAKWYIIGGLTPKPVHQKEWIDKIVEVADAADILVYIKDNAKYPIIRKELL